jgi:hypothetical protein
LKNTDPFLSRLPGSDWQILGELELPVGTSVYHAIDEWLTKILGHLHLYTDFRNKVLKSAQDALARVVQMETVLKFKHVHLVIYAQSNGTAPKKAWSFFRVDKLENRADDKVAPNHAIEFYLYVEGE